MSKKEVKDPNAVILIRRLLQIIDLDMIEELQEAEESLNVSRNLEIAGDLKEKKGKNFFSRSSDKLNKILQKKGSSPIFNQHLTEESVIRMAFLIDYLQKCTHCEGIFRISGNKKRQEELKQLLDKDVEISFDDGTFTEHDVASVLKQFFAELPEPIITSAHIKVHVLILGLENKGKQIKALQLLFLLIPPPNRHLMLLLLELLHEVAINKENKMNAFNLAVVFAPSIILYKHKSSSCLSAVPEDITTFTAALAFMIDHVDEIFTIPDDLLHEIEEYQQSKSAQVITRPRPIVKEGNVPMVGKPVCSQVDARVYHTVGSKCTADALTDLYAQMSEMEDTPMKRRFFKTFADFYPGTPPFKPKIRKLSEDEERTMFATPKIISPRLRGLSRLPLQTVNATRSETENLCDSPTGHFRSYRTPAAETCAQSKTDDTRENEVLQVPMSPCGNFQKSTPHRKCVRNPFRRKRTKTIGSSSGSLSLTRVFSPKPRRTSSSSQLERSPCVQLRTSTTKDTKNTKSTVPPVIRKSLIGRDIRSLYTTPMNSKAAH